jgi:thymidylate kinase
VGADGAGKSTMSALLYRWLSWKLDVKQNYLGSNQASWLSDLFYYLFRIARRGHKMSTHYFGESVLPTRGLENIRQLLLYVHYLSVGRDRLRTFRAGQAMASAGSLVLYDRFPLATCLDGPKIQNMFNGDLTPLAQIFSRWEQELYKRFNPPDIFFLLDVSPEMAFKRKPDHDPSAIETKYQALQEISFHAKNRDDFVPLDADRPFDDVALSLKNAVWRVI